jgi:hypothetical protein
VRGARYDGFTSTGYHVFLKVDRVGTRLADYDLGGPLVCSDGRGRALRLLGRGERPTTIGAGGSFSYSSAPETFTMAQKLRRPVRGTVQTSLSGRFPTADGATVSVTISFRSRRLSCSGTNQLALSRDGTVAAPFRGGQAATGRYRAGGHDVEVERLTSMAPGGFLPRFRITPRVACRNGRSYRSPYAFDHLRLSSEGRGFDSGRLRYRFGGGYGATERYRVSIAFTRSGTAYRVDGAIAIRSVVTLGGRPFTSCASRRTFSGGFAGGPANLF